MPEASRRRGSRDEDEAATLVREQSCDARNGKKTVTTVAPEIQRYLGIEKAKVLALLLVLASVVYHALIHLNYGMYVEI